MFDKNAVCKGICCRRTDRKFKSFISKKTGCGLCMIEIDKQKNLYCTIDELFLSESPILKEKFLSLFTDGEIQDVKNKHDTI